MDLLENTLLLLVGLGNPGVRYGKTRHNLGFYMLDAYVSHHGSSWKEEAKFKGMVAAVTTHDRKVFCLKPQTFMNLSGMSVQSLCAYHKIKPHEVMVVVDDVSIPWGRFKISTIPGTAGHNGIKNIIAHLGEGFCRYRIGLGSKPPLMALDDFVLSPFSEAEQQQLPTIAETFEKNTEVLIDKGVQKGLNFIER